MPFPRFREGGVSEGFRSTQMLYRGIKHNICHSIPHFLCDLVNSVHRWYWFCGSYSILSRGLGGRGRFCTPASNYCIWARGGVWPRCVAWLAYCSLRWGVGGGTIHSLLTGPGLTLPLSRRRVPLCFLVAPGWRGPRRADCQGGTTCSASPGWYWTNASWFSVGNHKIRKVIISPNT